ncbi:MAG: hypothetical protein NW214_14455 [Pseudanabaenaceae cyanobacterium bins.39]|nr:hypothetical protein [Pseudanabaenaceae cyanobacterium bins.39]
MQEKERLFIFSHSALREGWDNSNVFQICTLNESKSHGFPRLLQGFPQSVGLIGMRDVRNYKYVSGGSDRLNTSSPFNIKVQSFTLRNFN